MSKKSDQAQGSAPFAPIPGDRWNLDATVSLLREGYLFIPNRCARHNSDIFRTRLMLRDVICLKGPEAAKLVYGSEKLTRVGSMPQTVLRLLQDKDSVQQLDGETHRHRKAMFVRMLMTDPEGPATLVKIFRDCWNERASGWEARRSVRLAPEAEVILAEAAFRWTGVPPDQIDLTKDSGILAQMIEGAGHIGPRTWIALFRRSRLERKLSKVIAGFRLGRIRVAEGTPTETIALHRDLQGQLLSPETAAVELINLLRPIVAIGRYIVFAAMALHENSDWCRLFEAGNDELLADFVEEVRRISPFFPFVGAMVKDGFEFQGYQIPKGQWLLFDLYGTTHDAALFPEPDRFKPQRQLSWRDRIFTFIPQGAGDAKATHRCPGELVTVEIIKEAIRLLCLTMSYDVGDQDLRVPLKRIPAGPVSDFEMTNIRKRD